MLLCVCVPLMLPVPVTEGVGSPGVLDILVVAEGVFVPLSLGVVVGVEEDVHVPVLVTLNVGVPDGEDVATDVWLVDGVQVCVPVCVRVVVGDPEGVNVAVREVVAV